MWLVAAVLAAVALEVFLVAFRPLYSPPNEVTIQVAPWPGTGQRPWTS
jgi:hypothetical protein